MFKWRLFAFLLVCLLVACGRGGDALSLTPTPLVATPLPTYTFVPTEQWLELDLDALHEQIFVELMRRDPEWATDLGVADQYNISQDRLTNVSVSYQQETGRLMEQWLVQLQAVDPTTLTQEQRLSNEMLIWYLSDQIVGYKMLVYDYLVNQVFGVHNTLPTFFAYSHQVHNQEDAQDYIARLGQVGGKLDQTIASLQYRAEQGVVPPAFVFERVLGEIDSLLEQPVAESLFFVPFQEKLALLPLTAEERSALESAALMEVEQTVYAAYERLAEYLGQLQSQAPAEGGMGRLAGGEAYYAYMLRHHTTTELMADGIHALGLAEVARVQEEIRGLLQEEGVSSVQEMYRRAGGIQLEDEASRQQALDAYRQAMVFGEEKMGAVFGLRPQAQLEIVPVPAFRQGGPGAYYNSPPLDGSRPGYFSVDLTPGRFVSFVGLPTLAYHEGIPGHHYQSSLQSEMSGVPTFRRAIRVTSFAEGWALYAERLAFEYGVYEDNPYGNLGRLQAELFRSVRLVVDTGIHHLGWTRQEAIDYFVNTMNWSVDVATNEIERYIVWPGQATAYKVGQLTISRLRQEAQTALGGAFDLSEFHTIVLQNGDLPLPLLEEVVQHWVDSQ